MMPVARALGAGLPLLLLLLDAGLSPPAPAPGPDQRVAVSRPAIVWIGGGWFTRGSAERDLGAAVRLCRRSYRNLPNLGRACVRDVFMDEVPQDRVWVSAYGIDRTEVTNAAYRRCVADNRCLPPRISDADAHLGGPEHPVAGITWDEAQTFCHFAGGRLPTEAEWERAARGGGPRRFPWGMHYNPRLANHGRVTAIPPSVEPDGVDGHRFSAPVGSYPDGASAYGLLDMAGNVFEWTADYYEEASYALEERIDPRGAPLGNTRVIRGGSWRYPALFLRAATRVQWPEGIARQDIGFRCAYDPPADRR